MSERVEIDRDRAERICSFLTELAMLGYERGVDEEVRVLCETFLTGDDTHAVSWGLTNATTD